MARHASSEQRSCAARGCREQSSRSYSVCDRHSCYVSTCRQQPQFIRKNKHSCAGHVPCKKKECSSYAPANLREKDSENFSLYCEAHRCAEDFCMHEAPHELIEQENGTDYALRVCEHHFLRMKCSEDDCTYARDANDPSTPFCSKHKGCVTCNDRRQSNSQFCFNHKCRRDGCKEVVEDGLYFCVEHKCQADHFVKRDSCDGVPYILAGVWQKLCAKHICAVSLNKKYRELACPGYNDGLAYCPTHRCKDDRCTKPRIMDFEDDSDFCRRHDDARKADAYATMIPEEDAETSFSGMESHVSSRRGGARTSMAPPINIPLRRHRDSAVDVDNWRHTGRRG